MPRITRLSEGAEGVCPVCSETINIFAIGMCDHPVCYSCCTRMRVLSEQMQCAICRVEIPKVIFIQHPGKYEQTDSYNFQVFRKFKIYFENDSVQDAFYELLDHACQLCMEKKKFRTFAMLRDHMRKEHAQHYCDLCVSHLRVFSHERKFYDRTKLGLHRRLGDEDDKSHRGHPLCEFCDERFLDNDELVRHLRKEHYFCHFCDADGITNQFYSEYSFLREHFREGHYLCEEGECMHVEFTNAFRGEIDMKAHIATEHTNKMRKSQARHARTIDIGFNLTPRPGHGAGGRRDRDRNRDRDREYDRDRDQGGRHVRRGGQNNCGPVISGDDYEEVQQENQSRSGRGKSRGGRGYGRDQRYTNSREEQETARAISASLASNMPVPQNKDFPGLDGRVVAEPEPEHEVVRHDPAQSIPDNMANYVARNNNCSVSEGRMAEEDFPSLGGKRKNAPSGSDGNAAWAFKPTKKDFPALGNSQKQVGSPPTARSTHSVLRPAKAPPAPAPIRALPPGPAKRQVQEPTVSAPLVTPKSLSSIGSALLGTLKSNSNVKNKQFHHSLQNSRLYNVAEEDFPTLGGSKPTQQTDSAFTNTKSSSKKGSMHSKSGLNVKTVEAMFDEEFPSLGARKGGASQPLPTPVPVKEIDAQSIATKKLQNQQKHLENELFDLPTKEPVPEKPNKTQSKPTHEKTSETVKKEDKAAKTSKVQAVYGPKSRQRKNPVEEKPKESLQESSTEEEWQMQPGSKSSVQKSSFDEKTKKSTEERSFDDHWDAPQVQKTRETKKKKKAEKFEEEYPSLGGGDSAAMGAGVMEWGKKDTGKMREAKEPEKDVFQVLKAKKKNKKEKDNANKQKADNEPEPTWGYDPHFVESVIPKPKPKEPPGLVYKENKEPKRDKDEPWGHITGSVDDADFPSLFKSEEVYEGSALKDQSNFTLATLAANMRGFPVVPVNLLPVKGVSPELINNFSMCGDVPKPSPPPGLGFPVPASKPPPPGFGKLVGGNDTTRAPAVKPAPPPGFVATPSLVSPLSEPENNNLPPIEYQKPEHFMERNIRLISEVQAYLGDSEDKFLQFKKSSGRFRQGKISGSDYYDACMNIIGPDGFCEIFSELLALLPDIDKQHELLTAHSAAKQPKRGMVTKKEKAQRKAWATADRIFSTCPTCQQVLVDADVAGHGTEHHMDMDFPTLGATPGNKCGFSAWVKGT